MPQTVRIAVTRRDGKDRVLMNSKDTTAGLGESVRWLCTNLDDEDRWVQLWDFKRGSKKKNPLSETNPKIRVPGAGRSGNPNTRAIAVYVDVGAETGTYYYKIRVGTSESNLKVASDPKLRVDDGGGN